MEKNTYLDDLTPYFMGLMPLETLEWYINKFPEHEGLKKHWETRFNKDFPNESIVYKSRKKGYSHGLITDVEKVKETKLMIHYRNISGNIKKVYKEDIIFSGSREQAKEIYKTYKGGR